jgi:hypothetical protein
MRRGTALDRRADHSGRIAPRIDCTELGHWGLSILVHDKGMEASIFSQFENWSVGRLMCIDFSRLTLSQQYKTSPSLTAEFRWLIIGHLVL